MNYRSLVQNEEFGQNTLTAVMYTRKDSGINSISDLKGKKVIFGGGKKALFAYIAPTYLLRVNGLQKGDYKEQIAKNPYNSIYAVFNKVGEAGCASNITLGLPNVKKKIKVDDLKKIGEIGPLPHLLWAVTQGMEPDMYKKVKTFYLELARTEEGKKILKKAKLTNFSEVTDYSLVKKVIKKATGEIF
jgi:phosphonate transport system substrate-binding protein